MGAGVAGRTEFGGGGGGGAVASCAGAVLEGAGPVPKAGNMESCMALAACSVPSLSKTRYVGGLLG